jgi:hypothetical protein
MKKIPMLERFAAQSLVDYEGELIFSKEKFAELIIQECIDCCGSQADRKNIRKCFGLPVESNVMYPGPETIGHHSQYERKYNIPDNG